MIDLELIEETHLQTSPEKEILEVNAGISGAWTWFVIGYQLLFCYLGYTGRLHWQSATKKKIVVSRQRTTSIYNILL